MRDGDEDEQWKAFMSYQLYRFIAELRFFSSPSEAMKILRSPAASMSTIEGLFEILVQMFNITEMYEKGPWQGKPKINRDVVNMVPVVRQYYRIRDLDEQNRFMTR